LFSSSLVRNIGRISSNALFRHASPSREASGRNGYRHGECADVWSFGTPSEVEPRMPCSVMFLSYRTSFFCAKQVPYGRVLVFSSDFLPQIELFFDRFSVGNNESILTSFCGFFYFLFFWRSHPSFLICFADEGPFSDAGDPRPRSLVLILIFP